MDGGSVQMAIGAPWKGCALDVTCLVMTMMLQLRLQIRPRKNTIYIYICAAFIYMVLPMSYITGPKRNNILYCHVYAI